MGPGVEKYAEEGPSSDVSKKRVPFLKGVWKPKEGSKVSSRFLACLMLVEVPSQGALSSQSTFFFPFAL